MPSKFTWPMIIPFSIVWLYSYEMFKTKGLIYPCNYFSNLLFSFKNNVSLTGSLCIYQKLDNYQRWWTISHQPRNYYYIWDEDWKNQQLNLLKEKLDIVNHIACQRMDSSIQYSSFCCIFFNRLFKITKCFLSCLCKPFSQTKCWFPNFSASLSIENCLNLQKNTDSILIYTLQCILNPCSQQNNHPKVA